MIIDCNYKDENKGFSNLEKETLYELFDELNNIQNPISKFKIFQIEYKVTGLIKKLLDICNKNIFSNFNLELRMEDDTDNAY